MPKGYCVRCQKESKLTTMSIFNIDEICESCKKEEKQHPLYEEAKKFELEEVRKGNYKFKGIFGNSNWKEILKKTKK